MALIPSIFGGVGRRSNIFDPFSLDIWDPFEGLIGTLANVPTSADRDTTALINWRETHEAHIIQAELPGLSKEEVKVEIVDDRVLQIRGEKTREKEEKDDKWHRVERGTGRFVRRFRLPENTNMDQIKANMEKGVLTVIVPKEEQRRPTEVKSIDIGEGSERGREEAGGLAGGPAGGRVQG